MTAAQESKPVDHPIERELRLHPERFKTRNVRPAGVRPVPVEDVRASPLLARVVERLGDERFLAFSLTSASSREPLDILFAVDAGEVLFGRGDGHRAFHESVLGKGESLLLDTSRTLALRAVDAWHRKHSANLEAFFGGDAASPALTGLRRAFLGSAAAIRDASTLAADRAREETRLREVTVVASAVAGAFADRLSGLSLELPPISVQVPATVVNVPPSVVNVAAPVVNIEAPAQREPMAVEIERDSMGRITGARPKGRRA